MAQPLAPPPDYTTVSLSPAIHSSSTTHIEQDTSPATPTSNLNMVLDVDGSATDRELEEGIPIPSLEEVRAGWQEAM